MSHPQKVSDYIVIGIGMTGAIPAVSMSMDFVCRRCQANVKKPVPEIIINCIWCRYNMHPDN